MIRDDARLPAENVDWVVEGQLLDASNVVLRLKAGDDDDAPRAVYKPVRGERPLADFPRGTLAHREVATFIVAQFGGWGVVPETRWYDGEYGPGSLQRWVGSLDGTEQDLVRLATDDEVHDDDFMIADFETDDGDVYLVHGDDPQLREIALLDVICNNADRKGSHVLPVDGHLYAIDNGLNFHVEDKLRTVLWGWSGQALTDAECERLERIVDGSAELRGQLQEQLSAPEIDLSLARSQALLSSRRLPMPPQDRHGLPWPPI